MQTRPRFQPVNPTAIRELRRQLGWSQAELGKRAGYCERVIRKAEAGGSLSVSTIENLVQTFVANNLNVTTRELIYSEENLAQIFVKCYENYGVNMLKHCEQFLSNDFVLNIPASKNVMPYAGEHLGKDEFQSLLEKFFRYFSRQAGSPSPTFLSSKGRAIACFEERLRFMDCVLPPIWVNVHFYFKTGQISRVDIQCDYVSATASAQKIYRSATQPVSVAHNNFEHAVTFASSSMVEIPTEASLG